MCNCCTSGCKLHFAIISCIRFIFGLSVWHDNSSCYGWAVAGIPAYCVNFAEWRMSVGWGWWECQYPVLKVCCRMPASEVQTTTSTVSIFTSGLRPITSPARSSLASMSCTPSQITSSQTSDVTYQPSHSDNSEIEDPYVCHLFVRTFSEFADWFKTLPLITAFTMLTTSGVTM